MSGRAILFGILFSTIAATGLGVLRGQLFKSRQLSRIEALPALLAGSDRATSESIAAQMHIIVARLDAHGTTIFRTATAPLADGWLGLEDLSAYDARLPPWPAREEVRGALAGTRSLGHYTLPDKFGSVLVQTLAEPVPGGGVLYIMTGLAQSKLRQPQFYLLVSLSVGTFIYGLANLLARLSRRGPKVERL